MALSGAALPVIPTTTEQAAATSSADEPTTEAGAPSASAAEVESVDAAAVDAALTSLSDLADEAFGTDAVILAEQIRSAPGGIPTLVSRMQGGGGIHLEAQQDAMSILCNMLADSFDPNGASDTLNAFIAAGGLEAMLALLSKQDADNATLLFAAAMAQNATALDPAGCCATLRSLGADAVLASLLTRATDEDVAEHAAGALANLRAYDPSPPPPNPELEERLRLRRLRDVIEAFQSKRGVGVVQKYAKRWIDRHRAIKTIQRYGRGSSARIRVNKMRRPGSGHYAIRSPRGDTLAVEV